MPTSCYARFVARRQSLTGRPADVVITVAGSGDAVYHRVRATFLRGELEHSATGFRTEGHVDAAGRGAVVVEHPFGGSVIEGYHRSMSVVLDDAVVEAEDAGDHPDAPSTVRIWCADPALRAALEACVRADVV